jgi:hypothetical protein
MEKEGRVSVCIISYNVVYVYQYVMYAVLYMHGRAIRKSRVSPPRHSLIGRELS